MTSEKGRCFSRRLLEALEESRQWDYVEPSSPHTLDQLREDLGIER